MKAYYAANRLKLKERWNPPLSRELYLSFHQIVYRVNPIFIHPPTQAFCQKLQPLFIFSDDSFFS